ncbi:MAG: GntR family transcriptional regulator [Ruminococcaceae bacterium]|nr:GntR family transcriptional regulator [Oscillospiraceae bacterium]
MNKNLSTSAYETIKQMILSGELKQGQAISINAMAETLSISRTPVTNACQRLEFEKFLTILPKQGVIINTISLETACGIYELRAAIESYNAKRIMDLLDDNDIQNLKNSIQKQLTHAETGDARAFMNEDTYFHRYILDKNTNYELVSVVNQLYERAYMLGIQNSLTPRIHGSIQEHRSIIDALEKRDRQGFADAIEKNILNGFRNLTARCLK